MEILTHTRSGLHLSEHVVYLHLFTLPICGLAVAQHSVYPVQKEHI